MHVAVYRYLVDETNLKRVLATFSGTLENGVMLIACSYDNMLLFYAMKLHTTSFCVDVVELQNRLKSAIV